MPLHDATGPASAAAPTRARRGGDLDFSDYLDLRRQRDLGRADAPALELLSWLETRLPVPFADAIPNLATLADAPAPPPRELTREALRVAFAMREELARVGATRDGLHVDLPEGRSLKAWLDFMETERRIERQIRGHLRELDAKIWAMMSGARRMPTAPAERQARP